MAKGRRERNKRANQSPNEGLPEHATFGEKSESIKAHAADYNDWLNAEWEHNFNSDPEKREAAGKEMTRLLEKFLTENPRMRKGRFIDEAREYQELYWLPPQKLEAMKKSKGELETLMKEVNQDTLRMVKALHEVNLDPAALQVGSEAAIRLVYPSMEAEALITALKLGKNTDGYKEAMIKLKTKANALRPTYEAVAAYIEELGDVAYDVMAQFTGNKLKALGNSFANRPAVNAVAALAMIGGIAALIGSPKGTWMKKMAWLGLIGGGAVLGGQLVYPAFSKNHKGALESLTNTSTWTGEKIAKVEAMLKANGLVDDRAFKAILQMGDLKIDHMVDAYSKTGGQSVSTIKINPNELLPGISVIPEPESLGKGIHWILKTIGTNLKLTDSTDDKVIARTAGQYLKEHYSGMKFKYLIPLVLGDAVEELNKEPMEAGLEKVAEAETMDITPIRQLFERYTQGNHVEAMPGYPDMLLVNSYPWKVERVASKEMVRQEEQFVFTNPADGRMVYVPKAFDLKPNKRDRIVGPELYSDPLERIANLADKKIQENIDLVGKYRLVENPQTHQQEIMGVGGPVQIEIEDFSGKRINESHLILAFDATGKAGIKNSETGEWFQTVEEGLEAGLLSTARNYIENNLSYIMGGLKYNLEKEPELRSDRTNLVVKYGNKQGEITVQNGEVTALRLDDTDELVKEREAQGVALVERIFNDPAIKAEFENLQRQMTNEYSSNKMKYKVVFPESTAKGLLAQKRAQWEVKIKSDTEEQLRLMATPAQWEAFKALQINSYRTAVKALSAYELINMTEEAFEAGDTFKTVDQKEAAIEDGKSKIDAAFKSVDKMEWNVLGKDPFDSMLALRTSRLKQAMVNEIEALAVPPALPEIGKTKAIVEKYEAMASKEASAYTQLSERASGSVFNDPSVLNDGMKLMAESMLAVPAEWKGATDIVVDYLNNHYSFEGSVFIQDGAIFSSIMELWLNKIDEGRASGIESITPEYYALFFLSELNKVFPVDRKIDSEMWNKARGTARIGIPNFKAWSLEWKVNPKKPQLDELDLDFMKEKRLQIEKNQAKMDMNDWISSKLDLNQYFRFFESGWSEAFQLHAKERYAGMNEKVTSTKDLNDLDENFKKFMEAEAGFYEKLIEAKTSSVEMTPKPKSHWAGMKDLAKIFVGGQIDFQTFEQKDVVKAMQKELDPIFTKHFTPNKEGHRDLAAYRQELDKRAETSIAQYRKNFGKIDIQ